MAEKKDIPQEAPFSLAEIAEAKRQKILQEKEEKNKALNDQIENLTAKQKELEDLLTNFQEAYNQLDENRLTAKEKKNIFRDTLQKLSDVQFTIDDLKDSAEMQDIQTARANVRTEIHNLKTKKGEIQSHVPSLAEKKKIAKIPKKTGEEKEILPTKNEIISAIKERIVDIKNQIQELQEQTPEGRAKKREECKKVLLEKRLKPYFLTRSLDEIFLVANSDLAVAEKYGEDMVRKILIEFFSQQIDEREKEEKERKAPSVANIDIVAQRTKDMLPAKIDLDWASVIFNNFTAQHPDDLTAIEKRYLASEKNKSIIEQAMELLKKVKERYQPILEDIFNIDSTHQIVYWVGAEQRVAETQKKIDILTSEIKILDSQISAKKGFLDRINTDKYNKKIEDARDKRAQKQEECNMLKTHLREQAYWQREFSKEIEKIIKTINFDFKKELKHSYSLGGFLDTADQYLLKKAKERLSKEEEEIYQQFLQLFQANKIAKENYQKIKDNFTHQPLINQEIL